VSVLGVLSHLNYQPWFALAEFVDNSLQSYVDNRESLVAAGVQHAKVTIDVSPEDGGRIVVRDNAAGIGLRDFPRAFRAAEVPPSRRGLSEFGMGMKSAACWFAKKWTVRTKSLGESIARRVHFDVQRIVKDSLEELEIEESPADSDHHFTEIILEDLHRQPHGRTLGKIREHLCEIYRVFIRSGELSLLLNGTPLVYEDPEILVAPVYNDGNEPVGPEKQWRKPIAFDFGLGLRVEGFAAIRKEASTRDAGFSLFRRKRLIVGSADEKYRPQSIFGAPNTYVYQRLFGELHVTGFGVTHTKDGFQWDENEDAFLAVLREHLDSSDLPLLKQSRNYRAGVNRHVLRTEAAMAANRTSQSIQEHVPPVARAIAAEQPTERTPERFVAVPLAFERVIDIDFDHRSWRVVIELTEDPAVGDWLEVCNRPVSPESGSREIIGLRIALLHPFMVRFAGSDREKIEPLLRVAAALALGEKLSRSSGVALAGSVRMNLNRLLREALHRA
jgi:hypothetical protein